ncbi:ribulose-phosphate 3-epimerase [Clostridium sp. CAG:1193]|nr:ribulose-phosphate 3-epimerase [Clostridium sp. CAG:1193]
MTKVSASILSVNDLDDTIKELNTLDIDYIHLDIMDGKFVPNTSFTYDQIKKIIEVSEKPFDVHLMVRDVEDYIYHYAMLNTEYITFHYEVLKDLKIIKKIKNYGIKCGISVKPSTDIELIYELLPYIDMVLIMSVEPGRGGQKFIDNSLNKIKKLKDYIKKNNLNVIISVDGGINNNTGVNCVKNGADMLVVGSALINSNDKENFIKELKS